MDKERRYNCCDKNFFLVFFFFFSVILQIAILREASKGKEHIINLPVPDDKFSAEWDSQFDN